MNRCEWIVCERRPRWAAALRTAVARDGSFGTGVPRLVEVRTLSELTARLEARSASFALVEVHRDNVGDILAWLVDAEIRFPTLRFAAALDSDLVRQPEYGALSDMDDCPVVSDALAEAGAAEIADSPRRLHGVLELGRRHAELGAAVHSRPQTENLSVRAAVWASLPWQGE